MEAGLSKKFIRVWNEVDIEEISRHLIIIGDLLANCGNCSQIGLNPSLSTCPGCKTEFKYATFISERDRGSQIIKMRDKLREKIFIDYSDFKRCKAKSKAKDFFK